MTTKELKSYIDRILGNSIRCLLPSYWWRKALGAIVDKAEDINASLTRQIDKTKEFATAKFIFVPMPPETDLPSMSQLQHNIKVYSYLYSKAQYGVPSMPDNPMVYLRCERTLIGTFQQTMWLKAVTYIEPEGIASVGIIFRLYTDKEIYTLYPSGYTIMAYRDDVGGTIDAEMSDTSTNPVQNKVITKEFANLDGRVLNIEDFFDEGAKLNLTIKSNQDDDDVISEVKAKITYDGGEEYVGTGVVGLPVFTDVTITFPDVEGYKTPEPIVFTTGALPISYSVTYETEIVTVNVFTWDNSPITTKPIMWISYNGWWFENVWTGNAIQKKIPFGADVTVSIFYVEGYITPAPVTFIASQKSRAVNLLYSEMVGSWILIDQNISDPSTMISGDINGEHIQLIRRNSHRYVGKYTEEGTVTVCQLDDSDSNYYKDGGNAILTGEEGDVFMKLPKFWYKVVNVRTDVFSIGFYCGEDAPSGGWKAWEGDELIGVYMATKRSGKTMSVSGIKSELMVESSNVHEYNGTGFSQIKWKHHNIMAVLYCAMYGNTNSQQILGYGHSLSDRLPSGQTNELGMSDSVNENGDENVVNFWGLENWWGDLSQALCNTSISNNWVNSSSAGGLIINITEDDGTKRTMILKSIGYATKFVLGDYLDMLPSELDGSATTGYCDFCGGASNAIQFICVGRTDSSILDAHGIFCFDIHASGFYNYYVGSRLAFKGNIIIENNSTTFKSLTAIK